MESLLVRYLRNNLLVFFTLICGLFHSFSVMSDELQFNLGKLIDQKDMIWSASYKAIINEENGWYVKLGYADYGDIQTEFLDMTFDTPLSTGTIGLGKEFKISYNQSLSFELTAQASLTELDYTANNLKYTLIEKGDVLPSVSAVYSYRFNDHWKIGLGAEWIFDADPIENNKSIYLELSYYWSSNKKISSSTSYPKSIKQETLSPVLLTKKIEPKYITDENYACLQLGVFTSSINAHLFKAKLPETSGKEILMTNGEYFRVILVFLNEYQMRYAMIGLEKEGIPGMVKSCRPFDIKMTEVSD
jgi:hypothetical protein